MFSLGVRAVRRAVTPRSMICPEFMQPGTESLRVCVACVRGGRFGARARAEQIGITQKYKVVLYVLPSTVRAGAGTY